MAQARSNIPTVAERLKDRTIATPSISSRHLSTYDERRPNYVNYDRSAGDAMAALGRALSGFNKQFDKMATDKLDKMVEEEVARGDFILKNEYDTEDALRNRKEWKQLIKEKPEYAGLSPWVAVGYERSRMRELGMEMKSGLKKYIDENGLLNAEDPRALQGGVNQYIKSFREQAGIDSYNDKLLIAEYFSPIEADARQSVTNLYDNVQMAQREAKMVNQYVSEAATMIGAAEEAGIPVDVEAIQALGQEAALNGMDESKLPEFYLQAFQTAYAKSKNRKTLNAVGRLVVGKDADGKDITLKDTPDGAQWWRRETDNNIAEDKRKEHEAIITAGRKREEIENKVISTLLFSENGQLVSFDDALTAYTKELGREATDEERMYFRSAYNRGASIYNQTINLENSTADSLISYQTAIDNLYSTVAGDDLKKAATDLLITSKNHPLVKQFWSDVMSGNDTQSKATAAQVKEDDKTIEDTAGDYVDTLVAEFFKTDVANAAKNKLYISAAKDLIKNALKRDYTLAFVRESETLRKSLPDGRTELNSTELREARVKAMESIKDTSIWSDRYRKMIDPNRFAGSTQGNRYSWMNTAPADQLPVLREQSQVLDTFLESPQNQSTFRSTYEMSQSVDVLSMFSKGITTPTPQDILTFSKPHLGLQRATISADGKTYSVPADVFTTKANAEAQAQFMKTTFPTLTRSVIVPSAVSPEERQACNERSYTDIEVSPKRPAKGLEPILTNQQARMFLYTLDLHDLASPPELSSVANLMTMTKGQVYDGMVGIDEELRNILFYRAGLLTAQEVSPVAVNEKIRAYQRSRGHFDKYKISEHNLPKIPEYEESEIDGIE